MTRPSERPLSVAPAVTDDEVKAHVSFAADLTSWMERAGVNGGARQADLGVGFADIIHAARQADRTLRELLATDPTTLTGADHALTHLGYLHALFLTEIKEHLADLEREWSVLEAELARRAWPDEEGEASEAGS